MKLENLPFPVYGDTYFRGKCPKEDQEQIAFFGELRRLHPDTWGALAIHPRNEQLLRGGQFSRIAKHKAEGMTKGASDVIIPSRMSFVCELKRQDHTLSSWQSGQVDYLTAAQNAGAFACVALGWRGAWAAFEEWLKVSVD